MGLNCKVSDGRSPDRPLVSLQLSLTSTWQSVPGQGRTGIYGRGSRRRRRTVEFDDVSHSLRPRCPAEEERVPLCGSGEPFTVQSRCVYGHSTLPPSSTDESGDLFVVVVLKARCLPLWLRPDTGPWDGRWTGASRGLVHDDVGDVDRLLGSLLGSESRVDVGG